MLAVAPRDATVSASAIEAPPCRTPYGWCVRSFTGIVATTREPLSSRISMPRVPGNPFPLIERYQSGSAPGRVSVIVRSIRQAPQADASEVPDTLGIVRLDRDAASVRVDAPLSALRHGRHAVGLHVVDDLPAVGPDADPLAVHPDAHREPLGVVNRRRGEIEDTIETARLLRLDRRVVE